MTGHEHERAIDLITRNGVEETAAADAAWLDSHLAQCTECAEYAEAFERTGQLLRSVAVTASPALVRIRKPEYMRVRHSFASTMRAWS